MSINALSPNRFTPPQQARLNPKSAQQRSGASIHRDHADRLGPVIERMFQEVNDHSKLAIFTDRKKSMRLLRQAWERFFTSKDGFQLVAINRVGDNPYLLALVANVPPLGVHVAESISKAQRDNKDVFFIKPNANSLRLPTCPILAGEVDKAGNNGKAFIYPSFSTTDPQQTIDELSRTKEVIRFFNAQMAD